jgi:hypothetical protein
MPVRSYRAAVMLPMLTCLWGCANEPVARRGDPQQRVMSRSYPLDLATFREKIRAYFRELPNAPIPFHSMVVIELKPPNYSPDWLLSWVDPGNFLVAYKQISAGDRSQDLLIEEPTGDRYWQSEYATTSGPARFRCGFIVHLERHGPLATEVQVYEMVPEVWVGEHWELLHHGIGFGKVHDIRSVEPTVKDRMDLLDALNEIASAR